LHSFVLNLLAIEDRKLVIKCKKNKKCGNTFEQVRITMIKNKTHKMRKYQKNAEIGNVPENC